MFDKLVESTKQQRGRRAGGYLALTTAIYGLALAAFVVMAIVGFNPALAEEYGLLTRLTPPAPPTAPPSTQAPLAQRRVQFDHTFSPPRTPPRILPATEAHNYPIVRNPIPRIPGLPLGPGVGNPDGLINGKDGDPPPPPKPAPDPAPAAAPEPKPDKPVRLTSQLTQGNAIRKAQPPYPQIAKQVKVSGPVQVQINISETGEVTDAVALNGHPLLRGVSVQAARQWLFKPTELNGRPVRAIGVITFNFTLN